ncbi:MAG: hypothetical protein HXY42_10240 [Chloroflexi bacterium]|nr:hypothetical protein [Chloroflexota bacterium]
MNFDFGEILTRAGKITWQHKTLWLFSALPALAGILVLPFAFLPILLTDFESSRPSFFIDQPLYAVLFLIFGVFISLASVFLYVVSASSVTLGVLRAENGAERLTAPTLFEDGRKYWWRVLGVLLLTGLAVSIFFTVIFGCITLIGMVTMGLGFICLQPLFFLIYPLMLVLYSVVEEAVAAAVADELGITDAIQRGWRLVSANLWRIVLISVIVYFGLSLLAGIVVVPFMVPLFFMPFFMQDASRFDVRTIMLITGGLTLLFIPVMALVQGIGMTFLKATYTLVYLRLTRNAAPPILEANA